MTEPTNTDVQFNGNCAFALSTGKTGVIGDETVTLTKDGKTYRFLNPVAKFLFRILPGTEAKANATYNAAE